MSFETAVLVLAGVVALALVIHVFASIQILRALKQTALRMESLGFTLQKEWVPLSAKAADMMDSIRVTADKLSALQDSLTATSTIVHRRVTEVDAFIGHTTDVARLQIIRVQDMVDTAARRIEDTLDLVHRGIVAPVSEVAAVVRGLQVGLNVLLRNRRPGSSRRANPDEEMFI